MSAFVSEQQPATNLELWWQAVYAFGFKMRGYFYKLAINMSLMSCSVRGT